MTKYLIRYLLTGLPVFFCLYSFSQQKADILILNGRIADGTGNPWYRADIAVRGNRIAAIGNLKTWQANRVIDAKAQIVAPGFIDVHTHIEGDEAENPQATNFIYDGVTSVITGNCGSSETDIEKYYAWLDSLKLSVNVGTLLGQNDVRRAVMGRANREATEEELKRMDSIVIKAMEDGALGFSTGLIYIPGSYTPTYEIVRLAKIVSAYGGVYATHMRSEGDSVVPAIKEALHIGREANIPIEISHFKVSGQNNWGRSRETLALVEAARREGLDVTIDQYPYTASSTSLSTLLPDWALADGQDSIKARLADERLRDSIKNIMKKNLAKRGQQHWEYAVVAYFSADTTYNGKSIAAINSMLGRPNTTDAEAELICLMMEKGGAGMVFHGMDEADVTYFMKYPFNMFASDASIRIFGRGAPHPRGYGTNARVLARYVREQKIIPLEEAVRRMTSLPAQRFGLHDRGLIREGMAADMVVFDPETVQDNSTFDKPHQYSSGFSYVFVNGALTLEEGVHNGTRKGEILYKRQ
ncbi:MAG: D-aminoacylase [Chitinophagaceae bacterium]|nr:D-aminoacylase [Chitinophagaceae bacterium]